MVPVPELSKNNAKQNHDDRTYSEPATYLPTTDDPEIPERVCTDGPKAGRV